jgi:hypothetical protein
LTVVCDITAAAALHTTMQMVALWFAKLHKRCPLRLRLSAESSVFETNCALSSLPAPA